MLKIPTLEVLGSNLSRHSCYPKGFRGFHQSPHGNAFILRKLVHHRFLPNYFQSIYHPFTSRLLKASLSNTQMTLFHWGQAVDAVSNCPSIFLYTDMKFLLIAVYVYDCCWPSSPQSFSGQTPIALMTIFYCLRFDTPRNLEGQVSVFVSPRNRVARLYPQALGSLFVAFYDSQGYGGGIRPRLHTGS
jgi:hypothetical protein